MRSCGRAGTRTTLPPASAGPRSTARAAAALALALAGLPTPADAQCTVVQQPTKFDPAPPIVPADMFGRQDSMGIATVGSSPRLLVRYSYGFVVYNLGSPAAPSKVEVHSLKSREGYPKSGDGLERTGPIAVSADGARAVVPWTDSAAFGTVALSTAANGYSGGGDFAPEGGSVWATAVARVGSRYLGFAAGSNTITSSLYAADLTDIPTGVTVTPAGPKMTIASERAAAIPLSGAVTVLRPVEGARSWLVAASAAQVTVIDITGAGPSIPGLVAGFTARSYTPAALGISSGGISSMSAAAHPTDGSLHILVEGAAGSASSGVSLTRIDPTTGSATVLGTYVPPAGRNTSQPGSVLVPLQSDVAAVFLEGKSTGGLDVHVHAGADFTRNLASGLTFTAFNYVSALAGFRSSNNSIYLYLGRNTEASYAAALSCPTTPAPATAALTVDRIPASGPAQPVPDGGTVYVGDRLRIRPAYTPPDSIQPLLDWRLDYDHHAGASGDSSPTPMKLSNADASRSRGPLLPDGEYDLVGPCDPKGLADGGGAVPSTGVGCWASVTTNGSYTSTGQPDFAPDPAPGSTKELAIAFEAQNALNAGGSGLATHRIRWAVPTALLKSSAVLAGGSLEVEPQGSPADAGYRWYFSSVPVGQPGDAELALRPACDGATCAPGLTRPGLYRYWVRVPYRNGFRTPDCPGLAGALCTGDATKTVSVAGAVLRFTVPSAGVAGIAPLTIASQSEKGGSVTPCPASGTGFSYDLCEASGNACPAGDYSGPGLLAPDPFPTSGAGSLTIPMPESGSWGVRLKYRYTTSGSCADAFEALWPDAGAAQAWAPLTVSRPKPTIRLRNSADSADLPYNVLFSSWDVMAGVTMRAYAEVNGVRDAAPPEGMEWSYVDTSTGLPVTFGTTQGASFSIPAPGDFQVVLTGYGIDAASSLLVSPPSGTPPTATAVTFSKAKPAVGETIAVTCLASPGSRSLSGYEHSFGDGGSSRGSSSTVAHAWTAEGTKSVSCVAVDVAGVASAPASAFLDVGGPDVGPTVTAIGVSPESPLTGVTTTLTCSATAPPGRLIAGYEFDFGDSSPLVASPSNVATHAWTAAGSYPATCRAWDHSGRSGFLLRDVVVSPETRNLALTRMGSGSGVVSSSPSGLSCGSVCSAEFAVGQSVTLTALPAAGSRFAGWSGSGCAGVAPCRVVMSSARRVTAIFLPEAGTTFTPVLPCRVADTRTGSGAPLAAGEVRAFAVTTSGCSVPAGAQSAALNVTVTQPAAQGSVTLFPSGAEPPGTQTVSFSPGRTRVSPVVILLGDDGGVSVFNGSAGPAHVVLDVSGVFR